MKVRTLLGGVAVQLVRNLLGLLRPPPKLTVSQWATEFRFLSKKDSGLPGRWRAEPHQRAIMDAMGDPAIERVVLMAASQIGKTQLANNFLGYTFHLDPSNVMVVQANDKNAERWAKGRLDPLISETPVLSNLFGSRKTHETSSTLLHRQYRGGQLFVNGANSPADLASQAVRILVADEVDRFPESAGDEGDPLALAEQRTASYRWNRKIIHISTPLLAGSSRIYASYQESDRREWRIECPACETHFLPVEKLRQGGPGIVYETTAAGRYVAGSLRVACALCGHVLSERERRRGCERGLWIPTHEFAGTAGFHMNIFGVRSADLDRTGREIVAATGFPERLKAVQNLHWGLPYEEPGEAPDWQLIRGRREAYARGTCPQGVIVLTAAVDVQRDRLEMDVYGWGLQNQRWLIDHFVLMGRPDQGAVWTEVELLMSEPWRHESGCDLWIERLAVDSGDQAQVVYRWARRHRYSSVVMLVKGAASFNRASPVTGPTPVEVMVNGRKLKRGAKLWTVATDTFKSGIYRLLELERPADGISFPPGFIHHPDGLQDDWYRQLTAEKAVLERNKKTGFPNRVWKLIGDRNEALDLAVYSEAAAWVMGVQQWDEDRWAKEAERRGIVSPEIFEEVLELVEDEPAAVPPPRRGKLTKGLGRGRIIESGDPYLE